MHWNFNGTANLTVRAAYDALENDNLLSAQKRMGDQVDDSWKISFWKRIWRLDIQPKEKIFAWRIFHDFLPTGDNLMKKGISCSVSCPVCGIINESATHTLIYCWWAQAYWNMFTWGVVFQRYNFTYVADWLWYCYEMLSDNELGMMIHGARKIWFNRNALLNGKDMTCPLYAALMSREYNALWSECMSKLVVTDLCEGKYWSAPEEGFIKLNIDGSWKSKDVPAGVGVCGRNNKGEVCLVEAKYHCGIKTSLQAEELSLKAAMDLAETKVLQNVIFETDCSELMSMMMKGLTINGNQSILIESRQRLQNHQNWSLRLVRREANQIADFLAKRAQEHNWIWSSHLGVPLVINHLL